MAKVIRMTRAQVISPGKPDEIWELPIVWRRPLACCILVAALIIFLWSNTPYDIDDAPITYRYAENIAAGNGFVYNAGERVLGTSTPLFALILAAARVLGIPIPTASNVIGLLASVAVVAVTMALVVDLSGSFLTALLGGAILLGQGSFIRYSMAGMETPLYTLLILLSLLAFARKRMLLSSVLAALTLLMRLDGVAVAGAIVLSYSIEQRRLPLREFLVFVLVVSPWFLFSLGYFGSLVPLSMLAKQQHLQALHADRFWIWDWLFVSPLRAGMCLLLFTIIGLIWSLHARSELKRWLAIIAWFAAYLAEYTLVGIPFYEWYLVPAYPVLASLTAVGLVTGVKSVRSWPLRTRIRIAVPIFIALMLPYGQNVRASVQGFKDYLVGVERSRVLAGMWLHDHTPAESTVGAGAIGHVGYESNRYILDSAGLVTPLANLARSSPDYYVRDGYVPSDPRCGAIADFNTNWPWPPQRTQISRCTGDSRGAFDGLVLAEARITDWVSGEKGWYQESRFYLETQWISQDGKPERNWTLFVHFTRPDGTIVVQADHSLGLQPNGSILPPMQWATNRRMYDYVPLPGEPKDIISLEMRLGLWDPGSGDRLEAKPMDAHVDAAGRLVLQLSQSAYLLEQR
jgi:hypothetical protein